MPRDVITTTTISDDIIGYSACLSETCPATLIPASTQTRKGTVTVHVSLKHAPRLVRRSRLLSLLIAVTVHVSLKHAPRLAKSIFNQLNHGS